MPHQTRAKIVSDQARRFQIEDARRRGGRLPGVVVLSSSYATILHAPRDTLQPSEGNIGMSDRKGNETPAMAVLGVPLSAGHPSGRRRPRRHDLVVNDVGLGARQQGQARSGTEVTERAKLG